MPSSARFAGGVASPSIELPTVSRTSFTALIAVAITFTTALRTGLFAFLLRLTGVVFFTATLARDTVRLATLTTAFLPMADLLATFFAVFFTALPPLRTAVFAVFLAAPAREATFLPAFLATFFTAFFAFEVLFPADFLPAAAFFTARFAVFFTARLAVFALFRAAAPAFFFAEVARLAGLLPALFALLAAFFAVRFTAFFTAAFLATAFFALRFAMVLDISRKVSSTHTPFVRLPLPDREQVDVGMPGSCTLTCTPSYPRYTGLRKRYRVMKMPVPPLPSAALFTPVFTVCSSQPSLTYLLIVSTITRSLLAMFLKLIPTAL